MTVNVFERTQIEDAVAVIGMHCRVPDANSPEALWDNLMAGRRAMKPFSDQELLAAGVPLSVISDGNFVRTGTKLADIDLFDARFFGYTRREAELLDPQVRLFLETAWELFERAGQNPFTTKQLIGVYAGIGSNQYAANLLSNSDLVERTGSHAIQLSNERAAIATATAYKFNLRGPCIAVQTACSTSLVATHLACQGLLNGDCDMALAGAGAVLITQPTCYTYDSGGILSPDGFCRPYASDARGTVPSSGVAMVLLKRCVDALNDRDNILAVIRGSAVNNDGALKVGYSAPSADGQRRVIVTALGAAGIDPEQITYVEGHGTGTSLGDAIELEALSRALGPRVSGRRWLGSIKSTVGHLAEAAGLVGLIKAILILQHRIIPPNPGWSAPNKWFSEDAPATVNAHEIRVPKEERLLCGVSSFGMGGTNAHVIVEALEPLTGRESQGPYVLITSARTDSALRHACARLADRLSEDSTIPLGGVARTLQRGRRHFAYRRAEVVRTISEAVTKFRDHATKNVSVIDLNRGQPNAVFIFPGQGVQHRLMGVNLYRRNDAYRVVVDRCAAWVKREANIDLNAALYGPEDCGEHTLDEPCTAQLGLFVTQLAYATALSRCGIVPIAVVGHSLGECTAACIAGIMSEEDALRFVLWRGRATATAPPGSMLAICGNPEQVSDWLPAGVTLAAVNSKRSYVVSGEAAAIAEVRERCKEKRVAYRDLESKRAFHSKLMECVQKALERELPRLSFHDPVIKIASSVSGTWLSGSEARDVDYWSGQVTRTVRFAAALTTAVDDTPRAVVIDIGPGDVASRLARENLSAKRVLVVNSGIGDDDTPKSEEAFSNAIGALWRTGFDPVWSEVDTCESRPVVLPTYPFERERFWVASDEPPSCVPESQSIKSAGDLTSWFYVPRWKETVVESVTTSPAGQKWVLVDNSGSDVSEIIRALATSLDVHVTSVSNGRQYKRLDQDRYEMNLDSAADYEQMFRQLKENGKFVNNIVYLSSLRSASPSLSLHLHYRRARKVGFYGLVSLQRALVAAAPGSPQHLSVVTAGAHAAIGIERLCPENAAIAGPCLVTPQEYPNILCKNIDLDAESLGDHSMATVIIREILRGHDGTFVAYRNGARMRREIVAFPTISANDHSLFKRRGVYLITGGLGRIGETVAKYLASHYRARLILIGRGSGVDDSSMPLHTTKRALEVAKGVTDVGGAVLVLKADVAVARQLKEAFKVACRHFGKIDGVIHAAGFVSDGSAQSITKVCDDNSEPHFRTKVDGLLTIAGLAKVNALDFVMTMSSRSAIDGGLGLAAYSSANATMDAIVHWQSRIGPTQWLSINWDEWMFNKPRQPNSARAAILPDDGALCLSLAANIDSASQIIISPNQPTEQCTPHVEAVPDVSIDASVEATVAGIWRDLLGLDSLSLTDNFFEIGGNSLIGIQILARLRRTLGCDIPIDILFEAPTVEEMARAINERRFSQDTIGAVRCGGPAAHIVPSRTNSDSPLSYAQHQLWLIDKMQGESIEFHLTEGYLLRGNWDLSALESAIQALVTRHDAFRTTFIEQADGTPRQVTRSEGGRLLHVQDVSDRDDNELKACISAEWQRLAYDKMSLAEGPLLRFGLIRTSQSSAVLIRAVHHIVYDAWSDSIVNRELAAIYRAYRRNEVLQLPTIPLRYADYARWQREWLSGNDPRDGLEYWSKQLSQLPDDNGLQTDRSRPHRQSYTAGTVHSEIDPKLLRGLKKIAVDTNSSLYMVMLSALAMLLSHYSGTTDIVVGTPTANRENPQLDNVVGNFVNTLVIRMRADHAMTFRQLVAEVRARVLEAFRYQSVPFGLVVQKVATVRRLDRSPLFQVHFALQNAPATPFRLDGLEVEALGSPRTYTRHDIEIHAAERDGSMKCIWLYSSALYDEWRVKQMAQHYVTAVEEVLREWQ